MIPTPSDAGQLEKLYSRALRLYPSRFHAEYAKAMHQMFCDALDDRTLPRRALIAIVVRDLILQR